MHWSAGYQFVFYFLLSKSAPSESVKNNFLIFKASFSSQVRDDKTEEIAVLPCDSSVEWSYDAETQLFTYKETGTCLALRMLAGGQDEVVLAECDPSSEMQQWFITHFNPGGMDYRDLA